MEQPNIQFDTASNIFEETEEQMKQNNISRVSQSYDSSQSQLCWMDRQVTSIERQLLLNNNVHVSANVLSNWTKVVLTSLSALIPGIGQIVGIIIGLVLVSNDTDNDKRTFGMALLTISIITFIIVFFFWFFLCVTFGPSLLF